MAELKEIKEIENYIVEAVCTIIKEVRQHKGKPTEIIKEIILGLATTEMRTKAIAAFSGIQNIPEEVKNAGVDGWIDMAIELVIKAIPEIIDAVTGPVEPVVPAV